LHNWLDEVIDNEESAGFFRPYTRVRDKNERGIVAERWHLSHRKISEAFEQRLLKELLYDFYESNKTILLKSTILANFDCIFEKYIQR